MRVELDTNVLAADLRTKARASYRIIEWIDEKKITPVVSVPVWMEYEEVLKRPGLLPGLTTDDVDVFLDYLASRSVKQGGVFSLATLSA